MDVDKYIASGVLELYVAGSLTEEENMDVYLYAKQYPAIKEEILSIEASILELSKAISPKIAKRKGFNDVKVRIGHRKDTTVVQIPKEKTNWSAYVGWTATVLFGLGFAWFYNENSQLKSDIKVVDDQNKVLEQQIFESRNSLSISQKVLNSIRGQDIRIIPLDGQEISPESYAQVYWNKEEEKIHIDALGLPELPDGMVYQVWSFKLSPLTPTSIGLLDDFTEDNDKIFTLNNPNESEAFGVTMELNEGSEEATMEQLYALGAISSK